MRGISIFLTMLCLCGMMTGCAAPSSESLPQSDTVVCGDFTLTISTAQSLYRVSELDPNSPLEFQVTYTYTGSQSDITVYHSTPISMVMLFNEAGNCLLEKDVQDEGNHTLLQKGYAHLLHLRRLRGIQTAWQLQGRTVSGGGLSGGIHGR